MSPKKQKLDTSDIVSELSESAFFQPANPQTDKPTSGQVDKPTKLPKYTTHLKAETIQAIKLYAVQHQMRDYEVAQLAFDQFLAQAKEKESLSNG